VHYLNLEDWTRRSSPVHAREARVKLAALMVFLIAVGSAGRLPWPVAIALALLLLAGLVAARLPVAGVLLRAGAVLPFGLTLAVVTALAGDLGRGASLLTKSYLSAVAVVLLTATTTLPEILRALESFRAPRLLLLVVQFLYRYLLVLAGQATRMRMAAECRGGRGRRWRFQAAAGSLAVLFGSSRRRADGIYRAMLARGFDGRWPALAPKPFRAADAWFLLIAAGAPLAIRLSPDLPHLGAAWLR